MHKLITYTRANSSNDPYGCSIYNAAGDCLVRAVANWRSPINHAEIVAIYDCARLHPNVDWNSLTLYSTGEPCCMCAAACCWANLHEVVYATEIPFMTQLWGIEGQLRASDVIGTHPKQPKLTQHICQAESNQLFLDYQHLFAEAWQQKRWQLNDV